MGHLREGQGLRLLFDALAEIFQTWPEASLTVIGSGPLEKELISRVQKSNFQHRVSFRGYIDDHKFLEELVAENSIGLALYEPSAQSFTWYTDPGKPKEYMACGLPIIITNVPTIARIVAANDAGLVISFDRASLLHALHMLIDDAATYSRLRANAVKLASRYDWEGIFDEAFEDLLAHSDSTQAKSV
jgi:glycosyltransferase involved in cell wall biosynthesis